MLLHAKSGTYAQVLPMDPTFTPTGRQVIAVLAERSYSLSSPAVDGLRFRGWIECTFDIGFVTGEP